MINGVRREAKSPYKQSSSVEEQDVKPADHENFAAKSTKTKGGLFFFIIEITEPKKIAQRLEFFLFKYRILQYILHFTIPF